MYVFVRLLCTLLIPFSRLEPYLFIKKKVISFIMFITMLYQQLGILTYHQLHSI